MPRKEKIDSFKLLLGIKDNRKEEKYLIKANWDIKEAKNLYYLENKNYSERSNKLNNQENQKIIEFKISKKLKSINELFFQKNKDLYKDFIKFLKDKFSNVVTNFKDFLSLLENRGGLIIIFPEEKMNEVRNNMIRASNLKYCLDIMSKTAILPIIKDFETANELTKAFSVKNFPFYIFCKYEKGEKMTIKSSVESKFWIKDIVETLLCFFPETDIKQSIYNNLTDN